MANMRSYCKYATYLISVMFILNFGFMIHAIFFSPYSYAGLGYVLTSFLPLFLPALVFSVLVLGTYWYKSWKFRKSNEIAFLYVSSISVLIKAAMYIAGSLGY
jgi:hypothetical protein